MRLGERVLELLDRSGRSKADFARAIGTKSTTIIGWKQENRNPTSELILPICEYFGISPNELFEYNGPENGADDEEHELLTMFRRLDRKGRRAVLHEADVQDDRVRIAGDSGSAAQQA